MIAGLSTRAFAESAVHAGYSVAAIDAFGDLDHLATPVLSLARDVGRAYTPRAAALASQALEGDTVTYTSSFENHPRAVALLAGNRTLLGNPPSVLANVRDPLQLARALRACGLPTPKVHVTPPRSAARSLSFPQWLSKPRASGGGHGIAAWTSDRRLPRSRVLQEYIAGVPGSLAFVTNGGTTVPFALSRQLVGDETFGANGFKYCGNILACGSELATAPWRSVLSIASEAATAVASRFGLVGVNGVDFVVRDGVPYAIEVNPRYSASMELAERRFGFSVFAAHAQACRGEPPRFELMQALRECGTIGKAVLFARRTITLGDTRSWLESDDIRDVPHPGERIPRGRPICTIFARGRTDAECYAALARLAGMLYEDIESGERRWRIA